VLAPQGYVVLTFRDVTEKRSLESQLRRAKEFLERLIDSTVDGINAADIRGRVVLFNQGAARITGYSPDEVINRLPVWALYPGREASRIMTELRSNDFGGRGRLRQSRREVVGKGGVVIPVALTASIIYEAGGDGEREVATVGILSDLRERLRIEQRLSETEEKLAASERQSLLVELAGTTAHELNQPLTSVMGYAQLLKRRVPNTLHELHGYADVLLSEAERMADIVRKIGRITRYETKQYVGTSRILDLDKSSPEIPPISLSEISAPVAISSPSLPRPQHEDGPLFARPRSKPQSDEKLGPQAGHKAPPPAPPKSGPPKSGPRGRSAKEG
jgi:PAS domain S-box-containing protein